MKQVTGTIGRHFSSYTTARTVDFKAHVISYNLCASIENSIKKKVKR
jgi:hypothetical protein